MTVLRQLEGPSDHFNENFTLCYIERPSFKLTRSNDFPMCFTSIRASIVSQFAQMFRNSFPVMDSVSISRLSESNCFLKEYFLFDAPMSRCKYLLCSSKIQSW